MQCAAALAGPQTFRSGTSSSRWFSWPFQITTNREKNKFNKTMRICTKNKVWKESRYFCEKCKDNPALCVDRYFRVYQQLIQQNRYCIISFLIFRREIYSKFVPLIKLLVLTWYSKSKKKKKKKKLKKTVKRKALHVF